MRAIVIHRPVCILAATLAMSLTVDAAAPAVEPAADELAAGVELILESLADAPHQQAAGVSGDQRAEWVVRRAASAAESVPLAVRAQSLLIALGYVLDPSHSLLKAPFLPPAVRKVLSAERWKDASKLSRGATMYGRMDWLQHFVVSAGLTAIANPEVAEWMGIAKELADSNGKSGFSFADLQANVAGISFATRLLDRPSEISLLPNFYVAQVLPNPRGLPERLTWKQFHQRYGNTDSEAFRRRLEHLKQRVAELTAVARTDE